MSVLTSLSAGKRIGLAVAVVFIVVAAIYAWTSHPKGPPDYYGSKDARHSQADAQFLQDMIEHHEQAVDISKAALDGDLPPAASIFAKEIIRVQSREIEVMQKTLKRWGVADTRSAQAMQWMGMPTDSSAMPGMADQTEIDSLRTLDGNDAAALFFALMSRHHLGGAEMGEAISKRGLNNDVKTFGAQSARVQRIEINEMRESRERSGLAVPPGYTDPPTLTPAPMASPSASPTPATPSTSHDMEMSS